MNLRKHVAPALAATMLAIGAPLAGTAIAEQPAAVTLDDEQLQSFVAALQAVDTLEREYSETLAQAESDSAREAVIEEANEAMANAIDDTPGITLDQYVAILQQAQTDAELTERIMSMLEG